MFELKYTFSLFTKLTEDTLNAVFNVQVSRTPLKLIHLKLLNADEIYIVNSR